MKKVSTITAILSSLVFLFGCANNTHNSENTNLTNVTADNNRIVIAGSTTVAPVAQALADAFVVNNPQYQVEVQSMGTGAGMTSTIESVANIGIASRNLNADELEHLNFITFAIDGIAVVVNDSNPVTDLSFDEIQAIFLGKITNWSDVGGNNGEILVVSREAGSGARSSFESLANVSDEVDYILIGTGSNVVLTNIEQIPNSIGYVTYGLIEGRSVNALSVNGFNFSSETALSSEYPFAIGFHMAFPQNGVSTATQTFLNWVMSSEGQAIIELEEYIPVA